MNNETTLYGLARQMQTDLLTGDFLAWLASQKDLIPSRTKIGFTEQAANLLASWEYVAAPISNNRSNCFYLFHRSRRLAELLAYGENPLRPLVTLQLVRWAIARIMLDARPEHRDVFVPDDFFAPCSYHASTVELNCVHDSAGFDYIEFPDKTEYFKVPA